MAYGLECWDASGTKTLSTTDRLTRLCYTTTVSASSSGSVYLADIVGKTAAYFALALELDKFAHSVTRSGGTISWTPAPTSDYMLPSSSQIFVFVLD